MPRTPARCRGGSRDLSLGGPGLRGDVAPDAGRAGRAGLAGLAGALAHAGRPGRRDPRRGRPRVGPAGLPTPRATPARGGARDRGAARRAGAAHRGGAARAAGIGAYTAAAVACFAFGRPTVVVDTNVRRVLVRTLVGQAHAAPAMTRAEVPGGRGAAHRPGRRRRLERRRHGARALVCTARPPVRRVPGRRPLRVEPAGRPAYDGPPRRGQAWDGTDRQARGALLGVLRAATEPVSAAALARSGPRTSSGCGASTPSSPTGWSSRCPATATGCRPEPPGR